MLRKRARSQHHDQPMNQLIADSISESYFHSDSSGQNHKIHNSLLKIPGLFVGGNPKSSDSDSVRSPTSPLDFRIFSTFGNPFRHSGIRNEGKDKSWNCEKVGLSIIDSLKDETNEPGKVVRSFNKNSILLKRNLSVRSLDFCSYANSQEALKLLPKDSTLFPEKQQASANMGSSAILIETPKSPFGPSPENDDPTPRLVNSEKSGSYLTRFGSHDAGFGSGNLLSGNTNDLVPSESHKSIKLQTFSPFLVSEIEHSEDYTCVRSHGPNPKVTHIFGDHVLESHYGEETVFLEKTGNDDKILEAFAPSDFPSSYPSSNFLAFCYLCQKPLDGEDIYMYRGELGFCSIACRSQEIEFDADMEKTNDDSFETSDVLPNRLETTSNISFFIAP